MSRTDKSYYTSGGFPWPAGLVSLAVIVLLATLSYKSFNKMDV